MKSRRHSQAAAFLFAGLQVAMGAPELTQLHSFGLSDASSGGPYAELTLGSDGMLYGTTSAGGPANQGAVFRISHGGTGFGIIKSFGGGTNDGARPFAGVLEGTDGLLYGTTEEGGQSGFGTVFRVGKDGSNFTLLKSFTGGGDGAYPEARLLEGSDGLLYGSASGGGTNDDGVIFRLGKDGSGFGPLVQFTGTNGANPECALIEASDGLLYGTTYSASGTNLGAIFRLQKDGSGFAVLKFFLNTSSVGTNGAGPLAGLIEGTNGMLYGTASAGGTNASGTIYRLNKDGTGFGTLNQFATNTTGDGRIPLSRLIVASDNLLYGTTYDGGTNGNGTVFRIGQDGSNYAVIASLVSPQGPASELLEGTNGTLFGTSLLGGDSGAGTVYALQNDGSGFVILKSFSPTGGDGQSPYSSPIGASDNALYGTTRLGGSFASGTAYSLRFDGLGYVLLSDFNQGFAGPVNPLAGLLEGTNGVFYGVTQYGGSSNSGTIFSIEKGTGNLATVFSSTNIGDGLELRSSLILASDGAFYGTAVSGGSVSDGTVFRVNPDGSGYSVLKNFAFGATGPGANPMQPLLEASDHNLYGTTFGGGITNRGVIFSLSKDGNSFAVLKSFGSPASDGESPLSPLLEAEDGMLYGTTYGGGTTNNAGTVFRIGKDGTGFGVIQSFVGLGADGRHPCGSVVEWSDGALYGTTERGGTNDQGTLFKVNKDGSGYEVLANLGGAMGAYPRGGLTRGPDGSLYGTTDQGGAMGFGTVFRYGSPFGEITGLQMIGGTPTLTCLGQPGTNYLVQHTAQLGPLASWLSIYATNAPGNGQFGVSDPAAGVGGNLQGFYRLRR